MKFLGYILTAQGVKPDPNKLQGIHDFPTPKNVKQLKGLLGLLNFSSRFTPHLAKSVNPLLRLLKKGSRWEWTVDYSKVFKEIKSLFCEETLLYHPDLTLPYIVCTVSSISGLGAVLYQKNASGERFLVSCASRNLRGSEVNYFTTELELLAIVWALQKFRSFLLCSDVIIETDHKALSFLMTSRFLNDRLPRWILAIQDYAPSIQYIQGKDNVAADALSRLWVDCPRIRQPTEVFIGLLLAHPPSSQLRQAISELAALQKSDPKLQPIIDLLSSGGSCRDFQIVNDLLIKGDAAHQRAVLPSAWVDELVIETHEVYGHIGSKKCVKVISETFYLSNLKAKASRILRSCESCQRNKIYTLGTMGLEPWTFVAHIRLQGEEHAIS